MGEVFVGGEDRIGVGFDEVNFVVFGEAEVEARVAVDGEKVVDAFANVLDVGDHGGIEAFGELVIETPTLAIFFVPFGFVGGQLGFVRRHFAKNQFANGKDFEAMITYKADVKFAPFNVFFGDDVVVPAFVNELDTLFELFVRFDKGGLGDPERGFFLKRFDDNRKFEAFGTGDAFATRDGDEFGCVDAMIAENFFGDGFVFAEREAAGAATGKGRFVRGEERDDVLVEGAVVFELVSEVKDDVGLKFLDFLLNQVEVIEDDEVFSLMAEFSEGAKNISFGFSVFGF